MRAAVAGLAVLLAVATPGAADTGTTLHCVGDLAADAAHAPVLLVHGTAVDPSEFAWNYEPALTADGIAWCTVDLVDHAMGDIQDSAERIVDAIRTMYAAAGRPIGIVGHSQGGMAPRWALKWWPDTRAMVGDVVAIAATNHGTTVAGAFCLAGCAASIQQQRVGSAFLTALNDGGETFAGISYTNIYTRTFDEIVQPNLDDTGSTSLHTGDGAITNVAVQDVCPLTVADHLTVGTGDATAYALARDALDHDGPADPARIDPAVCSQLTMPATDIVGEALGLAQGGLLIAQSLAAAPMVPAEPPLRCYVTATCAVADTTTTAATAATPPPAPTTPTVPLPTTGTDAGAFAVAGALLVVAIGLRRTLAGADADRS